MIEKSYYNDPYDDFDEISYEDENYLHDSDQGDYYITQSKDVNKNRLWKYNVYNYADEKVATWLARENGMEMDEEQWQASMVKRLFDREAREARNRNDNGIHDLAKPATSSKPAYKQVSLFDDDDDYQTSKRPTQKKTSSYSYGSYNYPSYSNYYGYNHSYYDSPYVYTPQKRTKGYLEKLNKSDTLVIHKTDSSTTMLRQIYEGKGWDVLNDTYIDTDEMHELIKNHDKILMLGHGHSGGLIGGNINPEEAPLLEDKKLFVIWCNADAYFKRYLPNKHGFFCTKNAPSDAGECRGAGCGNISEELMLENITYWCKLCGDVVEDCLEGNVEASVDYIRKNYLEKYGNHPVTIYNADSAHCKGNPNKPLPEYEFKGEKLTPKDFPYPNFDEAEFLKHPTATIR